MTVMITDATKAGLRRVMTIDGIDLALPVPSLEFEQTPLETDVPTADGGTQEFSRLLAAGHADKLQRLSLNLPFSRVTGSGKRDLLRLAARAGYHQLCIWQPMYASYTAQAGQTDFYLPRYRRNAGQVFSGLISEGLTVGTDTVPAYAWLNDVPLTVVYQDGPTLVAPAAGEIAIAKLPVASGGQSGYVAVKTGDALAQDDVLDLEFVPVVICRLTSQRTQFATVGGESSTFVFTER